MSQTAIQKLRDRPCPSHSSNHVAMICVTCDERFVCLECIATVHEGHRFWVLERYIEAQKEKTKSLLMRAKDKIQSGGERLKVIDDAKQGNKNFLSTVTKAIRENEDYLKLEISKRCSSYVAVCKRSCDNNMELLESLEKDLQQRVEILNQSFKKCQIAVSTSTYEDFAPLNENLQQYIEHEFEMVPVLQQQKFVKPEITEKDIELLCGGISHSDWEPEELRIPITSTINDYEEPLPKPHLPSRPCPPLPKVPESPDLPSSSGSDVSQYVEIGAKPNVNLPLPIPVLNIDKAGKTYVDLSWNRPGNYSIEKRRKGFLKNWQKCADVTNLTTTYTIGDLKQGQELQFRLVYMNEESNENQEKRTEPTKYIKIAQGEPDPDYEFSLNLTNTSPLVPQKSSSYIESGERQIVCALTDNVADDQDKELTYRKGDFIEIEKKIYGKNDETVWARNLVTGKSGASNIKENNVQLDGDIKVYLEKRFCWGYHMEREDAECQLLSPDVASGTFLLRLSADKANFVLSVRDNEKLKHYKICNGPCGYCIASKKYFKDILELINFYQEKQEGLCHKLLEPFPKMCTEGLTGDIEVSRDTVRCSRKLGEGMFSVIHSGTLNDDTDVLVKEFRHTAARLHEFLKEARHLNTLKHPQLVKLLGVCLEDGPLFVTEFSSHGSLLEYLRKDNGKTIFVPTIVNMAKQIAGLMAYISEKGIVLTDLRLANWILGENSNVKLANLELAEKTTNGVFHGKEGRKFPIKWTAPEAIFSRTFSIKSDVWSFGIVLYELITYGKVPYQGLGGRELLTKIESGYRISRETGGVAHWPEDFYRIMKTCWEKVPESRPSFEYLHNFFTNFYSKHD